MKPQTRLRNAEPQDEAPIDPAAILRIGTIASVDLATGEVEVECGDVRTASIPFSTARAGATRIWSPPTVGEQVLLACPGGDIEAGVALGAIPQNDFPAAGDSLTELIVFEDGARIAYDPENHALEAILPDDATARIEAPGGMTIVGNVTIEGTLDVSEAVTMAEDLAVEGEVTAAGDMKSGAISLTEHRHSGVAAGGGITGAPQ